MSDVKPPKQTSPIADEGHPVPAERTSDIVDHGYVELTGRVVCPICGHYCYFHSSGRHWQCQSCGFRPSWCDCCGAILSQRYWRLTWGKHEYQICASCNDKVEQRQKAKRELVNLAVEDLVLAGALDPEDPTIHENFKTAAQMATSLQLKVPLPLFALIRRDLLPPGELTAALSHSDPEIKIEAAAAIGRTGQPSAEAIDVLCNVLRSGPPELCEKTGKTLLALATQWRSSPVMRQAIPGLIVASATIRSVQAAALSSALSAIDPNWLESAEALAAIAPLASAVTSGTEERDRIASMLERLCASQFQAISLMIPLLLDKNQTVRKVALEALDRGQPGWPATSAAQAATNQFAEAMAHSNRGVRKSAGRALRRIDPERYRAICRNHRWHWLTRLWPA